MRQLAFHKEKEVMHYGIGWKGPLIETQLIRNPKRNSAARLLCYIEVTYWVTRAATTGCFASPPACLSGFPGTSEGIPGPSPKHR